MKLTKYLVTFLSLIAILSTTLFIGCGSDDTPTGTTGAPGWPPAFNFKTGATFVYSTDSLLATGNGSLPTHRISTDMVLPQITFPPSGGGQLCYPFNGTTVDSNTHQSTPDLYYVRYDPAGFYYQYGIKQLININQTPSWDLIGDFTKPRGTSYSVGSIDYTVTLPPYNSLHFTGTLTGAIADSTSIQTTGIPQTIYCYRIELHANVSAPYSPSTVSADVFLDYYVGYTSATYPTNPAGLVELKSRPFNFLFAGQPVLAEPGFDRKLFSYTSP